MRALAPRLVLLTCVVICGVVLLLLDAFVIWRQVDSFTPRYDIRLDLDAPRSLGCFVAYFNERYDRASIACLQHDGQNNLVLTDVPPKVSGFRLDVGSAPDVDYVLRSLKFTTSKHYAPDPVRVLREFRPAEMASWGQFDVRIDPDTGAFHTLHLDPPPRLAKTLDLDLAAILGTIPSQPRWFLGLQLLFVLGLVVELGLIVLTWREAIRASRNERHSASVVGLALAGFALTVLSAFPGHTNFDEMYSLAELWSGTLSDIHPPLQILAWGALMDVGRVLGLGPIGQAGLLLIVQAAVFWSSAAIIASWLTSRWLARAFLLVLAVCPVSLVYLGHIGKDTEMAIALIAAVAWMGLAVRRRSTALLVSSLLPLFYGFAVRSNGPAAVFPLSFFWTLAYCEIRGIGLASRMRKAAVVVVSIAMFGGLIVASRALTVAVVKVTCCLGHQMMVAPVYDLQGISVRVGRNLVPPILYSEPGYDLDTIKRRYDPVALNWDGLVLIPPALAKPVMIAWFDAVKQYPKAYIAHRLATNAYFFGFQSGPPAVPYFSRFWAGPNIPFKVPEREEKLIDTYRDLSPQYVKVRETFESYFTLAANWPAFRLWPYMLVTFITLAVVRSRARRQIDPSLWLSTSAIAYVLPYIPLTNAAQFRYVWWSALALFCATVIRLDAIMPSPQESKRSRRTSKHDQVGLDHALAVHAKRADDGRSRFECDRLVGRQVGVGRRVEIAPILRRPDPHSP